MNKLFLFILILCYHLNFSQNHTEKQGYIDSLTNIIKSNNRDTTIGQAYIELSKYYRNYNTDTAINYALKAKQLFDNQPEFIKSLINKKRSTAATNIAAIYAKKKLINKSLIYQREALDFAEKDGDIYRAGSISAKIGTNLGRLGLLKEFEQYWEKAIKYRIAYSDSSKLAEIWDWYSSFCSDFELYEKANVAVNEALIIRHNLKDSCGTAFSLLRKGQIMEKIQQYDSALYYFRKASVFCAKIQEVSSFYYASVYTKSRQFEQAIKHCDLYEQVKGDTLHKFRAEIALGENRLEDALEHALLLQKENNNIPVKKLLVSIYKKLNQWEKAFTLKEKYMATEDSLYNSNIVSKQVELEYKEQIFSKQKEQDKKDAIEFLEKKKRRIIIYITVSGLFIVLILLYMIYNRLKITQKQKEKIGGQKKEIEEHHKEIKDSITYAKRIQSAILPPLRIVKKYLKESFILYSPKDIVAGDFFWLEYKNGKVLFAAADCTGHGVPGAMVSVICNNGLNRSVREHGLTDPGKILDKTREIIIQEFEKSEEEVKDGMDIALCSLNGNKLEYAGANNPLWVIRNGEVLETKANKQPIGKFDNLLPYTTHSFDLEKGDTLYIFSDGYVDQFGGEKGKKFKSKAFRELLLSIQEKAMEEQKVLIEEAFETWRGNLEQIDDVCVIGVRI